MAFEPPAANASDASRDAATVLNLVMLHRGVRSSRLNVSLAAEMKLEGKCLLPTLDDATHCLSCVATCLQELTRNLRVISAASSKQWVKAEHKFGGLDVARFPTPPQWKPDLSRVGFSFSTPHADWFLHSVQNDFVGRPEHLTIFCAPQGCDAATAARFGRNVFRAWQLEGSLDGSASTDLLPQLTKALRSVDFSVGFLYVGARRVELFAGSERSLPRGTLVVEAFLGLPAVMRCSASDVEV